MGRMIILLLFLFTSLTKVHADDSVSMAELAKVIHPLPPNWSTNSSSSYCDWKGVYCNDSNNVTKIDLHSMSLTATFPIFFPSFPQLEVLCFSDNLFTGSFPYLDNVPVLKELYLDNNNFTNIPGAFFQTISTHLQVLAVNDNPFSSTWRLDLEFRRFRVLKSLFASNSQLFGPIPDMFGYLSLTNLSLHDNDLSRELPSSLGSSQIKELWLQNQKTGLTGSIGLLSNMTYLSKIGLNGNLFSGPIPDLSNCTSLEILHLQYNHLTGVVPLSLAEHPSLRTIFINDNNLQGPFPFFLYNNTNASVINNNFCTGAGKTCDPQVTVLLEIASAFGYPYNLSLAWRGNDACSNWSFVKCNSEKHITEVNLGKQRLNGTISPAFANLTALQYLSLNDNNLTDHIPDSFTKLSHLRVLDVSNNNLYGIVPIFRPSVKLNVAGNLYLVTSNQTADGPDGKTATGSKSNFRKKSSKIILITAGTLGTVIGIICSLFIGRRIASHTGRKWPSKTFKKNEARSMIISRNVMGKLQKGVKFQEIQLFDFMELANATNDFHLDNKLGKGGYGLVYKGKLQDGQEIAVKRLLGASGQGLEEFMNEAVVISKLQHRNLVRLLGCCIDGEEKILVYEYMPNKSLDVFLFDEQRHKLLDWSKRFSIIEGICRGLLYLHRDSRLRIIHRDLKASNVLLDDELNPKISDFGLAKIFGGNESQANTRRIFGTYGYMSPEYAMRGQFSEKSDVFSFGVLTLEIVSGRRNSNLQDEDNSLLGYAWKLWSEGNILTLVDPVILDPSFHSEILRCIHVGMLCVQNFVKDRPTMSKVVLMLSNEIENLPTPNPPPFVEEKIAMDGSDFQTSQKQLYH